MEAWIALLRTQAFYIGNKEETPHSVELAKMSADCGCSAKTGKLEQYYKIRKTTISSNTTSLIIADCLQISAKHFVYISKIILPVFVTEKQRNELK